MKNYLVHYRTAERDSVSLRVRQNWIDNKSTTKESGNFLEKKAENGLLVFPVSIHRKT